jgi:hypothetical protein
MTSRTSLSPQGVAQDFLVEFESSVQRLQAALTDLILAVGVPGMAAREIGRRLKLSTNLAWKLSNLLRTSETTQVLQYLPGDSALGIFFRAVEDAGAPAGEVSRVRACLAELDRIVKRHAGTRAELDLMLSSSLAGRAPASQLESSRKLAFQGNSAIWGVRASAQIAVQILFPNADDNDRVDIAQVSGFCGFRRLRSSVRWPLVRFLWDLDEEALASQNAEPLDAERRGPGELPWLRRFSSDPLPPVEARAVQQGTVYEICEGPAGSTGEVDCLIGTVMRNYAPARRSDEESRAALFTTLCTPVETSLLDIYIHRSIEFPEKPVASLHSRMELGADGLPTPARGNKLPLGDVVQALGSSPPVFTTPDVPSHSAMMSSSFAHLGQDPDEFTGYRVALRYPPIPTNLILDCEIPSR